MFSNYFLLFQHIQKKSADWGVHMEVEAQLRYNLAASYRWHEKKSKDIEVDFIRFSFKDDKKAFKERVKTVATSAKS